MSIVSSHHFSNSESTSTIEHIVLRPPRAFVIQSKGDGFGSYIERLVNVAHESHKSFANLINTLDDLINYIRKELERSYHQYQFSIIIGKNFDHDTIVSNHYALIEHSGIKILIFSSMGCSFKTITTTTDDIDDNQRTLLW